MADIQTLRTGQEWFDRLLPDGFPVGGSTLISGPGGSGKPLIGNAVASAWLRAGGSAVFMSLQYPSTDFLAASLKAATHLDLAEYADHAAFVELDTSRSDWEQVGDRHLRANMVKPDVWDAALKEAVSQVPADGPGVLVFGSALNLLLFSPTYGRAILDTMKRAMTEPGDVTYLFSASTTAKRELIAELEEVADNLMMTRSERQPFRLFLRIVRMKGVPFREEEIEVPFPPEVLNEVKTIAEHSRRRVIPQISEI